MSSTKSLGVYIDENFSWNTHIESVCKKISSALGLIKRIRNFVPFQTLLNISNGLVKPQFDYCSIVWGCCSISLAEKLQKLQNRAARILLSAPYDSNATDLFRRLNWKNLRNQRLYTKAIMMFKTLNGETPDYLSTKFNFRHDTTSYSGARGAPWVRKFGNPLIRKILVLTSAYVRPSVQTLGEGDGSPKTA